MPEGESQPPEYAEGRYVAIRRLRAILSSTSTPRRRRRTGALGFGDAAVRVDLLDDAVQERLLVLELLPHVEGVRRVDLHPQVRQVGGQCVAEDGQLLGGHSQVGHGFYAGEEFRAEGRISAGRGSVPRCS